MAYLTDKQINQGLNIIYGLSSDEINALEQEIYSMDPGFRTEITPLFTPSKGLFGLGAKKSVESLLMKDKALNRKGDEFLYLNARTLGCYTLLDRPPMALSWGQKLRLSLIADLAASKRHYLFRDYPDYSFDTNAGLYIGIAGWLWLDWLMDLDWMSEEEASHPVRMVWLTSASGEELLPGVDRYKKSLQGACRFLTTENGRLVEKTPGKATEKKVKKQEEAPKSARVTDPYEEAMRLYKEGKLAQAFALFEESARLDNPLAQCKLADMYYDGEAVEEDDEKAYYWYSKAAQQGNADAQCQLGRMHHFSGDMSRENIRTAFNWYEKAALQGNAEAQLYYGQLYTDGWAVDKDYEKALYWIGKSAERGNCDGQFEYAQIYYEGIITAQDYEKAFYWFEKAAQQDGEEAAHMCGMMYYNGEGVAQDYEKALYWFEKAVRLDWTDSQKYIDIIRNKADVPASERNDNSSTAEELLIKGNAAYDAGDFDQALALFKKSGEMGNAEAQCRIGTMYSFGITGEQDDEKAIYWFTKSARQGYEPAQRQLAAVGIADYNAKATEKTPVAAVEKVEEKPQPVAESKKEAPASPADNGEKQQSLSRQPEGSKRYFELKEELARQGDIDAQFFCGNRYYYGTGTARDGEKAIYWYEKAALQGHIDAQVMCFILYDEGEVIAQDYEKALYWGEKAAAQGDTDAQVMCGHLYYNGDDTIQNFEKALYWFEKAAVRDNVDAQFMCGGMYYYGHGASQNYEKAYSWFEKAAVRGDMESQYMAGYMQFVGEGVPRNLYKARDLLKLATDQGHRMATKMYEDMSELLQKGD